MIEHDHADMVRVLTKDPSEILASLEAHKVDMIHAVMGISGEAGELTDSVKKYTIYNKPVDHANIIEELGDLEYYMERLRKTCGITRRETLIANMNKLSKRYPNFKYSDQRAQERADNNDHHQTKPRP